MSALKEIPDLYWTFCALMFILPKNKQKQKTLVIILFIILCFLILFTIYVSVKLL